MDGFGLLCVEQTGSVYWYLTSLMLTGLNCANTVWQDCFCTMHSAQGSS